MVLIDADGALVTKDELLALVWPGIFVDASSLKVQVCALRKALGKDRDFIRTEFGRGYRFTGAARPIAAVPENPGPMPRHQRLRRETCRKRTVRRSLRNWCAAGSNWPRRATCSSRIG
jgi:DNA-binding winged helix-turn-helix (wHTH) protein